MEKKTIGISAITAIIGALLMLGGVSMTDDNAYYCEGRSIVMNCDSLSQYYELDNGKCNNAKEGNKLCDTGWLSIVDETTLLQYNIYLTDEENEWIQSQATLKQITQSDEVTGKVKEGINRDKEAKKQELNSLLFEELKRIVNEDKVEEALKVLKSI